MPEAVREQADRELARFERMGESSPEATMFRNYLDWLLAVPWGTTSEETLDPVAAREVLDADHAGLDDVELQFLQPERLLARAVNASDGRCRSFAACRCGRRNSTALTGPTALRGR